MMDTSILLKSLENEDKIILKDAEFNLTGKEFVNAVTTRAYAFMQKGFSPDKSVMIRLSNKVNTVVSLFACLKIGATVFVANPYEPVEEAANKCVKFGINCLIGDKPSLKGVTKSLELKNVTIEQHFSDDYQMLFVEQGILAKGLPRGQKIAIFSSGTTGEPKAIVHYVENLFKNASMHADSIGLRADDIIGGVLPIYYSYGLVASLFASIIRGCCYCFQVRASGIDESWAQSNKVTVLSLTPFFANRLDVKLPSLRLLTLGGDALSREIALSIQKKFSGCELYSTYGLSEAGPRVSTWRFDNKTVPNSHIVPLGTPLNGVSLSLDSQGANQGMGELIVNTPTKMLGYFYGVGEAFHIPNWTGQNIQTGDIFELLEGEFVFQSRQKEMIVQNGEKLFPPVIESIIKRLDSVVDVNIIGVDAEDKGQIAKAKIHANKEIPISEIKRALLKYLPHAAIPSQFEFVSHINRTVTGKKAAVA